MKPREITPDDLATLVARPAPHLQAHECDEDEMMTNDVSGKDGVQLGIGRVDAMPLVPLPDEISAAIEAHAKTFATALAREGASSGAARRMLARDCSLAHGRLRFLEGLQGEALARWGESRSVGAEAERLGRLIAQEHRRLLSSLDLLRRLDRPEPAVVRVNRAAILVNR